MLKPSVLDDTELHRLQRVFDHTIQELEVDRTSPTADFIAHKLFEVQNDEFDVMVDALRIAAGKYGFRRKVRQTNSAQAGQ